MTPKCQKEVEKLTNEIVKHKENAEHLQTKMTAATEWMIAKAIRRERDREYDKLYKKEVKCKNLIDRGYSTSEWNAIKEESTFGFHTIKREKGLGSTDTDAVGWSKTANAFVRIRKTRWSGFMSNVKGCASMANTTDLHSVEVITKEEYETLKATDGTSTTNFAGMTETKPLNNAGI